VPTIPSSLLEPVWVEFAAQLPERGEFDPDHPLGCHRRRIPDRVVFEHLVDALVHGSGYERIASPQCSDSTIRRRLRAWSAAGVAEQVHAVALAAYDRIIGLHLADIPADGCITKAPCGGDKTGPSPVDRRKGGLKRSIATDGAGLPLGIVSAGANRHDSPLLGPHSRSGHHPGRPALARPVHRPPRRRLRLRRHPNPARRARPARRGRPQRRTRTSPGRHTMGQRTHHSWMNGYGKLRRCTDRDGRIVDFFLYLAAAFVTVRALIRDA
jgi:hypothetical protein